MTTELQESRATPQTIGGLIKHEGFKHELAGVLPRHCNIDRMSRMLFGAIRKTPKLEQCTLPSFANACRQLTAWGLEPDGHHAHLIPYGRECTLVIDYKGLVALCYRSGLVQSIHADVVHEGDLFRFALGHVDDHVPFDFRTDSGKPAGAGPIVAAYVVVKLNAGAEKHEVMTKTQVDAIRAKSKAGRSGPWVDHYAEMAKKTVFRRASKWLPLSAEIVHAFTVDHDAPTFAQAPSAPQGVAGLAAKLGMTTGDQLPAPEPAASESIPEATTEAPVPDSGEPSTEDLIASGELEATEQRSMLPGSGDGSYHDEGM